MAACRSSASTSADCSSQTTSLAPRPNAVWVRASIWSRVALNRGRIAARWALVDRLNVAQSKPCSAWLATGWLMVIVATSAFGDAGGEALRRTKPNPNTTARAAATATSGRHAARCPNPCSQAALTAEANHMIRKVRLHIPVTETICISGRSPYWE